MVGSGSYIMLFIQKIYKTSSEDRSCQSCPRPPQAPGQWGGLPPPRPPSSGSHREVYVLVLVNYGIEASRDSNK